MRTNIILVAFLLMLIGCGCQDVTIGFLVTNEAKYKPDTMIIRKVLDDFPGEPNPRYEQLLQDGYTPEEISDWFGISDRINAGEDYDRARWGNPWVSVPIEGVNGTPQIYVTVQNIKTETGDAQKLWDCLKVRGNGILEVPLRHDVPVGRYVISLNFTNEGRSQNVVDCFTIIVK